MAVDNLFNLKDSRFKIQDSRFKIQDSRFKIQDSRFKIQTQEVKNAKLKHNFQHSHSQISKYPKNYKMPKVTYINFDGTETIIELPKDHSLMEGAVQNDIDGIVAECGGSCMCATCHCYIDEAFLDKLPEMSEEEDEMLEEAESTRKENSRLGCQIRMTPELEGLVVRLPEEQD